MFTTCPECQYVRKAQEAAPVWQCPSCGVAYYKSAKTGGDGMRSSSAVSGSGIPWVKLLMVAAILYGAWSGVQVAQQQHEGRSNKRTASQASVEEMSVAEIKTLATTVRPGEVLMYSTNRCPYCAEAKGWLNQYGFAFTECNMDVSKQCEREFLDYGGDGTPYMIVRDHHMKNGFDSTEFLEILGKKS